VADAVQRPGLAIRAGLGRRHRQAIATSRRPVAGRAAQTCCALDEAKVDVLAFLNFPEEHWDKISSTNSIERVNAEIKRRANVAAIFHHEEAVLRLGGAMLMEQHDEWSVQRSRDMTRATIARINDNLIVILPAVAT
jgi:putative transposase